MQFAFGAIMILLSVFFFSNDIPGFSQKKKDIPVATKESDLEMQAPLVKN